MSQKQPYIPLYIGDWKKDPGIIQCSLSTRGAWIEIIFCMHELGVGELTGTTDYFARLCRCTFKEINEVLSELSETGTADISCTADGSHKVGCRRLMRRQIISQKYRESGSKGGSQTQANRQRIPEYDNDNEGVLRVREFARGEGIVQSDADWFFWKCQANGWTNGGRPIKDWKATLRSWQRARYLPSQKNADRKSHDAPRTPSPTEKPAPLKTYVPPPEPVRTEAEKEAAREAAKQMASKLRDQFRMPECERTDGLQKNQGS